MKLVFKDPTFSLQLLRAISETYYKGADIGECLSTAYRIKEGNFDSWHEEWLKTAKRIHAYANDCINKNHKVSAREAFLEHQTTTVYLHFCWSSLMIQEFKIL